MVIEQPPVQEDKVSTTMRAPSRWGSAAAWVGWFVNYPLSAFWLMIAGLTIAAVVELFRAPREALDMAGAIAALIAVVQTLARSRGIRAWPWPRPD